MLPLILIMEGNAEMKWDFCEKRDLAVLSEVASEQGGVDGCLDTEVTVLYRDSDLFTCFCL